MGQTTPTLYSYYRSSCSYRVRIALNLKNIEFNYSPIHLVNDGGENNSEEYARLNPLKQVPFFVHDEFKFGQSLAIIQYVDKTWPKPHLFHTDADNLAKQLEMVELINSGIQPIQNLSVLKKLTSDYSATQEQINEWSKHWIEKGFIALEQLLKNNHGLYAFGDQVSIVDLFLIPQVYNANRFNVDMDAFPIINKINTQCLEHSAFIKAHPDNQPDAPGKS